MYMMKVYVYVYVEGAYTNAGDIIMYFSHLSYILGDNK